MGSLGKLKKSDDVELDDLDWEELQDRLDQKDPTKKDSSKKLSIIRDNYRIILTLLAFIISIGFISYLMPEIRAVIESLWKFLVTPRLGILQTALIIALLSGLVYGIIVPKYYKMKKVVFLGNPSRIYWVSQDNSTTYKLPLIGETGEGEIDTEIKETSVGTVEIKPSKSLFKDEFAGFSVVVEKAYRHGYGNWIFITATLPSTEDGEKEFEDGEKYPFYKAEPLNVADKEKIRLKTQIEVLENKLEAKEEHIEEAYELLRELEEQPIEYTQEKLRSGMKIMEDAMNKIGKSTIAQTGQNNKNNDENSKNKKS